MTPEAGSGRLLRFGGVGLAALAAAAALFFDGATRWARPRFYQSWLAIASTTLKAPQIRILSVASRPLDEVARELARVHPGVVVVDPALWSQGARLDALRSLEAAGVKMVLGFFAEPGAGPRASAPLPRYSTLESMIASETLARLKLRDAGSGPWPAQATAGFVDAPAPPVFEARVLAQGPSGLLPSVALEALRRGQGVSPERIAYVEGIGLLVGPQITVPLNREGMVPLRFSAASPVDADKADIAQAGLAGRIVILASASHKSATVAGPKLAAETWASQMEDALNRATPRTPSSVPWLALAVGLAALAGLGMAAAYGMGPAGLAGLSVGLALLFPLASLGFFVGAGWWLPPEKTLFAIVAAGIGAILWPRPSKPAVSASTARPTAAASRPASPAPSGAPAAIPPQFSTRLRTRPGERAGPAVSGDPGIERDAQGGLVRVGKYRIVRKMGSGSAGDVFEGMDTQMTRRVAIKAMTRTAQLHFDHALERFVVEAKAAGSLNHPNINTIYDFGTLSNVSFMVLEYLDGVTLSQWMRANPPPHPEAAQEWVRQIASALDYAHEHRVIHRDLKPGNLMVVDGGHTIKLLDFGVAKLEDVMLTQTGMTVGTPSYMSPEQLQGEKVSAASDQYSLAVVLYQLYSHRLPYAGTRIPEICNRILRHEIIPLHEANAALPEPYWTALEKALRKDPADRYPSCQALAEALDRVKSAAGASTNPEMGGA